MKNNNTAFINVQISRDGYFADGMFIPKDEANRHYVELREWIENGGVVEPEFGVEEIKSQKYQELEEFRKAQQFQPIQYQNSEFSASEMARQNIMNNILVTSSSAQKYWLDKNNNSYEFSLKNFKELATLISKRDTKLYSIETEIKNAIKKLRSVKSLAAIIIPDLWHKSEENYEE